MLLAHADLFNLGPDRQLADARLSREGVETAGTPGLRGRTA
jgi:hypothetical protein